MARATSALSGPRAVMRTSPRFGRPDYPEAATPDGDGGAAHGAGEGCMAQ